jgi:hypothetical protein
MLQKSNIEIVLQRNLIESVIIVIMDSFTDEKWSVFTRNTVESVVIITMDSFTNENWLVFAKTDNTGRSSFVCSPKTDKTGPVQFCRFTKNRPVEFEISKI